MGNSQSSEQKPYTSNPGSPALTATTKQQPVARRKESTQGLSQANSKVNTPPTTNLISTSSSASTTTQSTKTHATSSSHTRARSITTPSTKPEDVARGSPSTTHQRSTSRSSTLPIPTSLNTSDVRSAQSPSSRPVDVPTPHSAYPTEHDELDSGLAGESPYNHAPSFVRPPRLPLPIEEEVHTPGSPIISPQDVGAPLDEKDSEGAIPRRSSVLSSTTADDDEIGDNDAFAGDQSAPTVPTTVEWKGFGDKVYVTGTFVSWERKFKLHRDRKTGIFSAVLQLKPGTHHVKFLVDDDMMTSIDLPTTVDFTNILVNYIEVVAPLPAGASESPPAPVPTEPMPIPGKADTAEHKESIASTPPKAIPIRSPAARPSEVSSGTTPASSKPHSLHEPIPVPRESRPEPIPSPQARPEPPIKPAKQMLPRHEYTSTIPQFLLDLDNYANPHDEHYQRASRVTNTLPHPPSLPMFLAKSILNGATPQKDDASVLLMPNHTVLNHLATSSIRSGVLATSGTTRYKRKVRRLDILSDNADHISS